MLLAVHICIIPGGRTSSALLSVRVSINNPSSIFICVISRSALCRSLCLFLRSRVLAGIFTTIWWKAGSCRRPRLTRMCARSDTVRSFSNSESTNEVIGSWNLRKECRWAAAFVLLNIPRDSNAVDYDQLYACLYNTRLGLPSEGHPAIDLGCWPDFSWLQCIWAVFELSQWSIFIVKRSVTFEVKTSWALHWMVVFIWYMAAVRTLHVMVYHK